LCGWLSFFLLFYVFLPAFILSIFLLLRIGSPAMAYWSSLAVLSGILLVKRRKIGVVGCLCFLLLVIFSHVVSWSFFDFFHDGLAYHQPATARIAAGFNPVYDGYMDLGRPQDNWSDAATYFPKATWYFAASVTAALGDIQLGKAYHLILFFSALFFVLHHTQGERAMKRLLWASACLNPMVFFQCTGYVLDSALGSLSVIALFYAGLHFSGKPVPRDAHVIGVVSLAMLFCVKTSGFAYGCVIVFCICLRRLSVEYLASKKNLSAAFAASVKLGLRIGIPLLLLVTVLGFSPYLTNLIEGRHVFYPLMRSGSSTNSNVPFVLETLANRVHPDAHNRVTRLLRSIASYPSYAALAQHYPAELKEPLWASLHEWKMYVVGAEFLSGGLGPLFFLLLLVSVLYGFLSFNRGNGWMTVTLCLMLFIQPHAWYPRYVPFLWMLPFVFCLSTPRRWDYLLIIPVLLAVINSGGVAYVSLQSAEEATRLYTKAFAPHRNEYVLLDKTVFRFDGIFDRFGIKQRFANPEQTVFTSYAFGGIFQERFTTGMYLFGKSIAFVEDIPPLPDLPVVFLEARSEPWTRMLEGIILYDPQEKTLFTALQSHPIPKGFWNRSGKIKSYMRVTEKPVGDMVFALTARLREDEGTVRPQKMSVYANNRHIGEWVWNQRGLEEKSIVIPLEALEESYNDPMSLLTLMFYLSDAETNAALEFSLMFEKMEFRATN
jgi:hypothetical protein